jgi:hypothetical protein
MTVPNRPPQEQAKNKLRLPREAGPERVHHVVKAAAERDVELTRIMDVIRHPDVRTVTGYLHRANLSKGHAGARLC